MTKAISTVVVFLLISTFTFAQKEKQDTITVKTNIYCSHCMQCGSCGPRINDHIRETNQGIKKVMIEAKANLIYVVYDPAKTDHTEIEAAINSAGFDANDKKAPVEAVNKLDGCCKKP